MYQKILLIILLLSDFQCNLTIELESELYFIHLAWTLVSLYFLSWEDIQFTFYDGKRGYTWAEHKKYLDKTVNKMVVERI